MLNTEKMLKHAVQEGLKVTICINKVIIIVQHSWPNSNVYIAWDRDYNGTYHSMLISFIPNQLGTNNTRNVSDLRDNRRKVRWRHFVPKEPQQIFGFAGAETIKQARSNLPKITRKKADALPNWNIFRKTFMSWKSQTVLNGITIKTKKKVSR